MPGKNRQFPHLLPDDILIWEAYLADPLITWDSIDYDVRVGKGRDPGLAIAPNIRQMAIDLSQRRIDAVGHGPTFIDIIEITRSAGMTALGQLELYPILYQSTFSPAKPLRTLLVAAEIQSDITAKLDPSNTLVRIVDVKLPDRP